MVEKLGICTAEESILTRMTEKLQRAINLLKRDAMVKGEAITDTLQDLAVYALILKIALEPTNVANTNKLFICGSTTYTTEQDHLTYCKNEHS